MAQAGIAEKVEEDIQYETGLPSKHKLTESNVLLMVDETGCKTNQLNNEKVGGRLFVLPRENNKAGAPIGPNTDLHFTVLELVSGTGEAVTCTIIFKSEQVISEIPIS